jgi:methyl-accepting chemotaxis protein
MVKWFKNRKISVKLIISFLFVAFLAVLVGVVGIINLLNIGKADKELYEENTLGLSYSGSAELYYQRIRYNLVKAIVLDGTAEQEVALQKIADYRPQVDKYLQLYEDGIISETDRKNFDELKPLWESYKANSFTAVEYIETHKDKEAINLITGEMTEIGNSLQTIFDDIFDYNTIGGQEKSESNQKMLKTAVFAMSAVILVALVLAVALGLFNAALIGKPLKVFASYAKMLAVGDMDVDKLITHKERDELASRKDEVGDLANAFEQVNASTYEQTNCANMISQGDLTVEPNVRSENDMLGKSLSELLVQLNQIIETIVQAADQVASGSDLISNSSTALSQGATEQASSVEELTASIEEISAQTVMNAQNAEKASSLAKETELQAAEGNVQMKKMLSAMTEINHSSNNINKIIKVIDDIAFQTNILALNAAVEAARAGQHGLGFAVVAEEVRTLAAKSASAAKETTELIEDSIRKVEAGTQLANTTAEMRERIVEQAKKSAELIKSIATASAEQSAGLEQINQGVTQISQVVQANAASAEESAAASEELSSQAAQLKELVSFFKLKKSKQLNERVSKSNKLQAQDIDLSLTDESFGKY